MTTTSLRVLTINTGKCDGPYRARLDALSAAIRSAAPDLVLAQEVFEAADTHPPAGLSTARRLAGDLDLAIAFHPIRRKPREVEGSWVDSYSGLATLSRWPMRSVTSRALPDDPEDGDRAVQFVAVETPAGIVRTANTHLTHLRHRDDLRVEQARLIAADPWWDGDGPAVLRVIGGDLNARPEHAVHDTLRAAQYLDAFAASGLEGSPTIRRETPNGSIEARLDYVYIRRDGFDAGSRADAVVTSARVVLDQAVDGILPSDHFGVLADLTVATRGSAT